MLKKIAVGTLKNKSEKKLNKRLTNLNEPAQQKRTINFNKYKEKVVKPYSVKTLKDYIVEYNHVVKNQEFVYPSEMCRNGIMELY